MAKDEFDLDSADFDFDKEMDKISGGQSFSNKPTTKREAVMQSVKDGGKGFLSGVVGGESSGEIASKLLERTVPNKLSIEYSTAKQSYQEIKDTVSEGIEGVKKEGKRLVDTFKKVIPGDNIVSRTLAKISSKLGDDEERIQELSKEQQQQNEINGAILASLGEQKTLAQQQEAVRQQMESERHVSQMDVLKSMVTELKSINSFNMQVANGYYRKSLEIQFKQLYAAEEQLGIIKSGFETFKNQFESIVKNTGLPEIVKVKQSEQIIKAMGDRWRQDLADTFYKDFNPFKNITDNLKRRLKTSFDNFRDGLGNFSDMSAMALDMFDQVGDEDMAGMGMTKSHILGNMLGDWFGGGLFRKVGNKLWNTKAGNKLAFGIKNMMMDPDGILKNFISKNQNSKSGIARLLAKGAGFFRSNVTSGSSRQNYATFSKNPNEPAIFDNRFKDSVIVVIPGLLSKIYSEVKTIRTKGKTNPDDNELSYDYVTQTFGSTKDVKAKLERRVKTKIQRNMGGYLEGILDLLHKHGGVPQGNDNGIKRALVQYLYHPDSNINLEFLLDTKFLSGLPAGTSKVVAKAYDKLKRSMIRDHYIQENWNMYVSGLKTQLVNVNAEVQELKSSGLGNIADELGLSTTDETTGRSMSNNKGQAAYVLSLMDKHGTDLYDKNGNKINRAGVADQIQQELANAKAGTKAAMTSLSQDVSDAWKESQIMGKKVKLEVKGKLKSFYNKFTSEADKYLRDMDEFLSGKKGFKDTELVKKFGEVSTKLENLYKKKMADLKKTSAYQKADATIRKAMESDLYKTLKQKQEELTEYVSKRAKQGAEFIQGTDVYKKAQSKLEDALGYVTGHKYYAMGKDALNKGKDYVVNKAKDIYNNRGETYNNIKENVKAKYEFLKKLGTSPEARKEQWDKLREAFFNSREYVTGKVKDFREYLNSLGHDLDEPTFLQLTKEAANDFKEVASNKLDEVGKFLKDRTNRAKSWFTSVKDKLIQWADEHDAEVKAKKEQAKEGSSPQSEAQAENVEAALRDKFFSSKEYLTGKVTDFKEWAKALGYNLPSMKGVGFNFKTGYKMMKGFVNNPLFKATRKLDRWLVGRIPAILGGTFKAGGKITKALGQGMGFLTGAALGGLVQAGVKPVESAGLLLQGKISATLDKISQNTEKPKEERKNSWASRLKSLFGKKDETKGPKEKRGLKGFVKDNISTIVGLGIGGVALLLSKMGVTFEDIKDGVLKVWDVVKWVGTGIYKIGAAIGNAISWIGEKLGINNMVKNFFGWEDKPKIDPSTGEVMRDENGSPIMESTGPSAGQIGGTLAATYAGYKVASKIPGLRTVSKLAAAPVKLAGAVAKAPLKMGLAAGQYAYNKVDGKLNPKAEGTDPSKTNTKDGAKAEKDKNNSEKSSKTPGGKKLSPGTIFMQTTAKGLRTYYEGLSMFNPAKIPLFAVVKLVESGPVQKMGAAAIDKVSAMKRNLSKIGRAIKNPKIIQKVGSKVITKVGGKILAMTVAAATGIGAVLTAGFVIWEIGWILYYMFAKDMSFWGALCYQLFGMDIWNEIEESDKIDQAEKQGEAEAQSAVDKAQKKIDDDAAKAAKDENKVAQQANQQVSSGGGIQEGASPQQPTTITQTNSLLAKVGNRAASAITGSSPLLSGANAAYQTYKRQKISKNKMTQEVLREVKKQPWTPLEKAMFMSNVDNETGGFRTLEENLNYSVKNIKAHFGKKFSKYSQNPAEYAGNPEKLANFIYADAYRHPDYRMGNTQPGDGWKYRGRGIIQTTGRNNYARASKRLGIDLVNNPDLLATDPKIAIKSAIAWWEDAKAGSQAFRDAVNSKDFSQQGLFNAAYTTRRAANGGTIGMAHVVGGSTDSNHKYIKVLPGQPGFKPGMFFTKYWPEFENEARTGQPSSSQNDDPANNTGKPDDDEIASTQNSSAQTNSNKPGNASPATPPPSTSASTTPAPRQSTTVPASTPAPQQAQQAAVTTTSTVDVGGTTSAFSGVSLNETNSILKEQLRVLNQIDMGITTVANRIDNIHKANLAPKGVPESKPAPQPAMSVAKKSYQKPDGAKVHNTGTDF